VNPAIADYVDRVGADLIVMTTHGRTGDERRRRGDDAEAGTRVPFARILLVVNGVALERVESIVKRLGTPQTEVVVRETTGVAETIVDAADGEDADLIVLAESESTSPSLPTRLAEVILRDWPSPVMMMRA
jgi:nucleotide-binding universal stress UspA family protein